MRTAWRGTSSALALLSSPRTREVQGYVQNVPQSVHLLHVDARHELRADAAIAFLRMVDAARRDGVALVVNTAFRTMEEQQDLFAKYQAGTGNLAARPGYSNHQGGIAVDIQTGGENTPIYAWLRDNAADYGFKRTVPSEPWHWEFRPEEIGAAS